MDRKFVKGCWAMGYAIDVPALSSINHNCEKTWHVLQETICHTEWQPKWCSSREVQRISCPREYQLATSLPALIWHLLLLRRSENDWSVLAWLSSILSVLSFIANPNLERVIRHATSIWFSSTSTGAAVILYTSIQLQGLSLFGWDRNPASAKKIAIARNQVTYFSVSNVSNHDKKRTEKTTRVLDKTKICLVTTPYFYKGGIHFRKCQWSLLYFLCDLRYVTESSLFIGRLGSHVQVSVHAWRRSTVIYKGEELQHQYLNVSSLHEIRNLTKKTNLG